MQTAHWFERYAMLAAVIAVLICAPVATSADPAKVLDSKDNLLKPLEGKFKDMLELLSSRHEIEIVIDQQAFTKREIADFEQTKVTTPKMDEFFVDTMLREVLQQVNAVYEVHGQRVVVVPRSRDGKTHSFPAMTAKQRKAQVELEKRLVKPIVEIEKEFDGDLKDILEFLSDRIEVPIIVDQYAFRSLAGKPDPRTTKVQLSPGKDSLPNFLNSLLKQVGGRYQIRSDHLRILPIDNSKS